MELLRCPASQSSICKRVDLSNSQCTEQARLAHHAAFVADSRAVSRAYKLGKKRWSYNQCALTLQQRGGYKTLSVAEAMSNGHQSLPDDQQV